MNSQEFRNAARFNIDQAIIEWKAEKIAEKFYAKWRAGKATDADTAEYHNRYNIAHTEVTTEEVAEVTTEEVAPTAAEVIAQINTNEAFGIAWGADGEVLTYEQTVEAIAKREGWFDRQGRWVNYARMMKEARAMVASK